MFLAGTIVHQIKKVKSSPDKRIYVSWANCVFKTAKSRNKQKVV